VLWCINEWLYPDLLEAKQATISPYIIEWGGVKVLSVEKKRASEPQRSERG
jgi:hypothetical protein